MATLHRLPANLIRWTSLSVCIALVISAVADIPFSQASSKGSIRLGQQGNGQSNNGRARRVDAPAPRTEPPAANLPNLNEVQHRRVEAPRAPVAPPSTIRSRRKPLEPRNGRRVGDPIPPLPVPTPSPLAVPSVLPTPRHEELATLEKPNRTLIASNFVSSSLPLQIRRHSGLQFLNQFSPLSDSPIRLLNTSTDIANATFDLATAPIPQSGTSKIAFTSNRDGVMQIYVMDADGSGQTRLTTDDSNNDNPRWSPNGAKILFQSDRDNPETGNYDIYVMNADGSGQTRLTTDANDDGAAVWSSDGTKIVFQSFRNGVNYQIYVMNADGTRQVNISNNGANDTQPSWSSDGAKIAFASDRDQAGFSNIYVMNANGSNQTRLTLSGTGLRDEQPVWSPDRTKVAFTSTRDSILETWQETDDDGNLITKSRLNINKEVYVMNPDGSGQTRLTNTLENDDSPCWAPDGTKIVFRSDRERDWTDPTQQIWTINADGSDQTLLSNNPFGDYSPSWTSPLNQPPVANPGGPYSSIVGQAVTFNGSGSFDPDGTISSYAWTFGDGTNGSGATPTHTYASAGTYTATLTIADNSGNAGSATASVTITANSLPTVSIISPANNAGFTAPANITITATASDTDGTISKVDFYRGTTLMGTDTTSPYSFSWNSVVAGNYSLTAKATDNIGATTTSVAVSITVNALPTVGITTPANGASFTAPANIPIAASATDGDGTISKVDFYQGTTLIGTDTTAPYSLNWNNVAAGSYSLTAKATDNTAATTTSGAVSVTVNALPTVNITSPTSGASYTAPANISISASATDSDGTISKVDFYQGTTLLGTDTTAPYSFNWNNVAAGSYSLTARATDNLAATTTSGAVNIAVNALPTVGITTPANGASFTAPANIPIAASATDGDGTISKVDFYQGTTLLGTDTTAPYSFNWNNVAAGSYSLTAKATDNTGATTISGAVSVTVNVNGAPAVSITSPAIGASFTAPANITIAANATDSDGTVSKVDFYQGATLLGTDTTTPYSFSWNNVAAGTYTLTATATDNSGASGSATRSVTVTPGNQPPVANPGGTYNGIVGQNIPFNGSGSFDPDGSIVSYAWTFGDGGIGSGVSPTHAYGTTGTYTVTLTVTDNLGAQASASTTISVSASTSDQYVTSFLQWGLARPPTGAESTYWTDIMRAAYPQGLPSMKLATRELGMTVFESAEYAARNRNDHWYVYDLYKTFLMREPDTEGWSHWEAAIPIYGRDQIRRGFDESTEFANIVATLNASGSPSAAVSSLATARVDPFNQSGNQLQARDAEWGVSLLSLPGRAGLDLGLGLSYSSLVWTNSGPYMYFDADGGSPGPGFHIGFPTIQDKYFDARVGRNVYLLTTTAGRKVELRQVGTSNVYESADSSYLQLTAGGSLLLRTTDGTSLTFGWTGLNEYRCTSILDRNGNYMVVNYDWRGDIQNVTDTLGRVITFNYDANANLNSITQSWTVNGVAQAHTWASFGWENLTIQPTLTSVVGTYHGEVMPVLKMVAFHDSTYTKFLYNGNGQVERITQYASDSNPATDNHPRNYTDFDYDSATTDCPRLTSARTWAEYWTGFNGVPAEVTNYFSVEGDTRVLTAPDGTVYKETYAGSGDAAWMRGLIKSSEVRSGGVQQKLATVAWAQDNTNVVYKTNPRVIETNVSDSSGNQRRTTVDYSVAQYAQYGLPYFVTEYAANGAELRRTYRDYNLDQAYLDRRIIGLVAAVHLTDAGGYQAKVTYGYDDPARLSSQATTATLHDQSYDGNFTTRGNVTNVSRWDVTDTNNPAKALTTFMNYNAAGSVVSTTDPSQHVTSVGYSDSFSDGNNSRNTFAYPTTLTDADNFSSTIQYNFDFGAKTRVQTPLPNVTTNQPGPVQTFSYDAAARPLQVTTEDTGAYTRYVYGPYWVQSFSTVNNIADEAYSITVFDGVGRGFGTASNHPGSAGGYRLVNTIFDRMGRAVLSTRPFEVDNSWTATGDDAGGVSPTAQTYDWQGRPLRTTHPDGTYTEASYNGCGCAGGESVTLTDEVGRQQRIYSDVLGRQRKTEVLNWDGSVYSTSASTFNARDQVMSMRQWAGAENGGGAYQDTAMSYDGYGRLQSKHVPEQNAGAATVYSYNSDDTIQSVTDARGASATYGYNNRHLVTSIDYFAPYGITPTPNVSFGYDAAGNRTSMTDGPGNVSYNYDSLSRLGSETRTFNGVGNYTLTYGYNLAGHLTSISDPFGGTLTYGADAIGRLNSVSGSGYGEVSQFATNIQYRAWGGLKGVTYNSSRSMSMNYNSRMLPTLYQLFGQSQTSGTEYQYHADGQISYARDLNEPIFDRSYGYDQVKRLMQAFSGSEARGGTTPDGPYRQTYSFDAFDNLTQRTGRDWTHNSAPVSFTYDSSTNRNPQWQYDADGRVTVQGNRSYSYNAVGEQTRASEGSVSINHDFDGDGFKVKRNSSFDYYLRSTALNGEIVAELNTQGQLRNRYVYANGSLLAQQYDSGWVAWKHRNPSNNSEWMSVGTGSVRGGEYDPVGTNFGVEDPYLDPGGGGGYGDWSGGGGIPSDLTTGCSWEGMAIGCQYAVKSLAWRGYLAGSRLTITTNLPGAREYKWETSHVRSSAVPWGEEPEWSDGDITLFRGLVPMPDTSETGIVPQKGKEKPLGGKTTGSATEKDPCAGIKILDYDKARDYGSGANKVTESGRDHILRNHVDSRPGKSQYETDPPQDRNAMFLQVVFYNSLTFALGNRTNTINKKGELDSITFVFHMPPNFPHHYYGPPITGMWIGRDENGNPTLFNTLHLDPDCETVRTSYPGRPR